MKRKANKKQEINTRDWGVVMMLAHTKPGAMKDRKKAANKKACRQWKKDRD